MDFIFIRISNIYMGFKDSIANRFWSLSEETDTEEVSQSLGG